MPKITEVEKNQERSRFILNYPTIDNNKMHTFAHVPEPIYDFPNFTSEMDLDFPIFKIEQDPAGIHNGQKWFDYLDPLPIKESKTQVQITINGENVYWIKIPKPPNYITLADIKNQLLSKPQIYGITVVGLYDYYVKTIKNGKIGLFKNAGIQMLRKCTD